MSLVATVKNAVKARPRVYDALNAFRAPSGDVERWLAEQSKPGLRFVQVGAADGLRWDPARRFIVRDRWRGVLIEPIPHVFQMLRANYAHRVGLTFVNAAIGRSRGTRTLWTVPDDTLHQVSREERMRLLRLASFSREHVDAQGFGSQPNGVACMTLADVIAEHMAHGVDLLISDAEGHDDEVLYSLDLRWCRPRAIVFEAHNLQERIEPLESWLTSQGYSVSPLGGDAIAVLSSTTPTPCRPTQRSGRDGGNTLSARADAERRHR